MKITFYKIFKSSAVLLMCFLPYMAFTQGAAINTTGANADSSAIFDASSQTQGLLIPRMTTGERNAIQKPALGLQIINTTTNCLEIYFNPMWQSIYCGCNPPSSPTVGVNIPQQTEITWNWTTVSGATGYKYNTANDYLTAIDNGTDTSFSQSFLTCGTAYTLYVWAYNNCGYSTSVELNSSTSSCWSCNVGDSKEGGIVFYCDYTNNIVYVSATSDQSSGAEWGCYGSSVAGTGTAIGTGQNNTTLIDNACTTSGIAADICNNLTLNTYTDWFLPSKDELNQMYIQKNTIGGFSLSSYWSSSAYSLNGSWLQSLANGNQYEADKNANSPKVRCIRRY